MNWRASSGAWGRFRSCWRDVSNLQSAIFNLRSANHKTQVAFSQDFLRHGQDKSKFHQSKQRRRNSSTLRCGFCPACSEVSLHGLLPSRARVRFLRRIQDRTQSMRGLNFLQVCSVLVIFQQSLSLHFVSSKERNFDGRGRRRVDSRKTSDAPFRPCSNLSPVWFRNVMPAL